MKNKSEKIITLSNYQNKQQEKISKLGNKKGKSEKRANNAIHQS